jgi:hypothetical protein
LFPPGFLALFSFVLCKLNATLWRIAFFVGVWSPNPSYSVRFSNSFFIILIPIHLL